MKKYSVLIFFCFLGYTAAAQKDTLRVMSYNVLYYGDGCQGPNSYFHNYLKTIIRYANADIVGLIKMASIPISPDDKYATAPAGFLDSVMDNAFDSAYSGRYAYCPFTNAARSNAINVLFYDKHKLGFSGIVSSYSNITDFNLYKLYYKDQNLVDTKDTVFIYVALNNVKSGEENESIRTFQVAGVMDHIKSHFTQLPNLISMGDFNIRNTTELCYQRLTANNDSVYRLLEPPFFPDHKLNYPADWSHNGEYAPWFSGSTREIEGVPNNCGPAGGAKTWYDHVFISPWLVNNTNYIKYIRNSYRTIGNDGKRYRIAVNNKNINNNTSVPAEVVNALYRMSNKYPIMISLEVAQNNNGKTNTNTEISNVESYVKEEVSVTFPTGDELIMHFPEALKGQEITLEVLDTDGDNKMKKTLTVNELETTVKCKLKKGAYTLKITGKHNLISEISINKN